MAPESAGKYADVVWQGYVSSMRDYDALLAKLSTAGVAVSVAIAEFVEGTVELLVVGAVSFAAAAVTSLLSLKLSAELHYKLASEIDDGISPQKAWLLVGAKKWTKILGFLNWVAFAGVAGGFGLIAIFALSASLGE